MTFFKYFIKQNIFKVILIIFLSTSFSANAQQLTQKQMETIKKSMIESYNLLQDLDAEDWEATFLNLAQKLRNKGFIDVALDMESLSDHGIKEDVLEIFKDKINQLSMNGIGLIMHVFVCITGIRDSHYCTIREHQRYYFWFMAFITLGDTRDASGI